MTDSPSPGPWGLNSDGHRKSATEAAYDLVQDAFSKHLRTRLGIARCTDLDERTLDQVQFLHLAEPWLPAVAAVQALEQAGLLSREFEEQQS